MSEERIFNTDKNLPLRSTTKTPMATRKDINEDLAKWGITKVGWHWDLNNRKCELIFELPPDKFHNMPLGVKLQPPIIWKRKWAGSRYGEPEIDWRLSIRLLWWYLHYSLAWVYANQSSPIVAFLPHVQMQQDRTVVDVILPRLKLFKALPDEKILESVET